MCFVLIFTLLFNITLLKAAEGMCIRMPRYIKIKNCHKIVRKIVVAYWFFKNAY